MNVYRYFRARCPYVKARAGLRCVIGDGKRKAFSDHKQIGSGLAVKE